jgi:hypothetical protein
MLGQMADLSHDRMSEGIFPILPELNGLKAVGHWVSGDRKTEIEK